MQTAEEIEIFRVQVSSRMRVVRKVVEATQVQAAEMCGVSQRSYKDYELGRRSVPVDVLIRFCHAFKVEPVEILTGSRAGPKSTDPNAFNDDFATGLLAAFGSEKGDEAIAKQVRLARYAFDASRAKGTPFAREIDEIRALTA